MSNESPRRLLRGLPGPPVYSPLAWYKAQQQHAMVGHSDQLGWILSQGNTPHYLANDSPLQAHPWIAQSHKWLQERSSRPGAKALDLHPLWHEDITSQFHQAHPDLAAPNTPAMRRPWIDAGLIDIQRTRGGVEIRYSTTGLIAIGIHSGVNDRWIMPSSLSWHRQHFEAYREHLQKSGFNHGSGKKALEQWHAYCRKSINQPGGFNAWSLGDPFMQGWISGRIHVSETPFSVVLYNLGALSLVDIFDAYPSHKDVFDYIRTHKRMDVLLEKIKSAQIEDPLGKKYPRSMPELPVGILAVHGD